MNSRNAAYDFDRLHEILSQPSKKNYHSVRYTPEPFPQQGDDVVFEPVAKISKSFGSPGHQTEIVVRGQGFVFADNGRFNHGTVEVQVLQGLSSTTKVGFRYFVGPDLFLGKNEVRPVEEGIEPELKDEEVTTHFWSAGVFQEIHDGVTPILYGRYGLRRYNNDFDQRDTDFCKSLLHSFYPSHL